MSTYYTQRDAIINKYAPSIASVNETYAGYASTINDEYDGNASDINNEYDGYKTIIEAKEITELYTLQDQQDELTANETARTEALTANESARTEALAANETAKSEALAPINEQKQAEIVELDITYAYQTQQGDSLRVTPINYDYLNNEIENIDITPPSTPTYTQQDLLKMANVMEALPTTVYNTKYIYLTFENKYNALVELSTQEHTTYSDAYDGIVETYTGYANTINETYDGYKTAIEAKEITELYTLQDQQDELTANEEARAEALAENETAKNAQITPLNESYLSTMATIAVALSNLANDKETGFIGDVHVNGDLHVDHNVNLEGNLNNIPIANYLTTTNLQTINSAIALKADASHNHDAVYAALNHNHDASYAALNHTHSSFTDLTVSGTLNNKYIKMNASNSYGLIQTTKTNGTSQLELATDTTSSKCGSIVLNQYTAYFNSIIRSATLLDNSGNTSFPGTLTAANVKTDNETRLAAAETAITTHNHDTSYAPINHNHDNIYAPMNHDHDLDYSAINHNHDSSYAALNHTHTTISNALTINGNLSLNSPDNSNYITPASFFAPNLGSGNTATLKIGKADSNKNCGYIGYCHNSDNTKTFIDIGMHSANRLLKIYYDKVESTNAITAPNLKTDNETRLAAAETAITTHNHDSSYSALNHTHTISEITDYQPYDDSTVLGYIATNALAIATHDHDTLYAPINHNHDTVYVLKNTFELAVNNLEDDVSANTSNIANNTNTISELGGHIYSIYQELETKASSNHNHDLVYSSINHNHDLVYSAINHTHTTFQNITVNSINGCSINTTLTSNGNVVPVPTIPIIKTDGVMEIGKYIDFHTNYDGTQDYGVRIDCSQNDFRVNKPFRVLFDDANPGLTIGTALSNNNSAVIRFNKANKYIDFGFYGNNNRLKVYTDGSCVAVGNITAPNLTATNETRLAAIETKHTTADCCKDVITGACDHYYEVVNNSLTVMIETYNSVSSFNSVVINSDGTKSCTATNTYTTTTYDEGGTTVYHYDVTITNVSSIDLDGPDSWTLKINDGLFNQSLDVEHNYYRNAANDNKYLTQNMLLEMIYPIGSIYTSTRNVNPANIFGGIWTAIVDRFMYCVDPTTGTSKQTGGSKKISVANLPPHNHTINFQGWANVDSGSSKQCINRTKITSDDVETGPLSSSNTGSGTDYMPPYMSVFAWERTA